MAEIGFSTGCFYKSGIKIKGRIKVYRAIQADALELSFRTPKELTRLKLDHEKIQTIKSFQKVTIHAPWSKIKYGRNFTSDCVIRKLSHLQRILDTQGIIFHPHTIIDPELLKKTNLPVLLENMDSRKPLGKRPHEFETFYKQYGFGSVLDIQHAYEQDSSLRIVDEFIDAMGEGLRHLRISGESNGFKHVPIINAKNKKTITSIVLERKLNFPKIIRGNLSYSFGRDTRKEYEYIRSFELN